MFEGLYLNEAGQSAAGKLLDHLVETHAAFPEVEALAKAAGGIPPTIALNRHLEAMAKAAGVPVALLAHDLHVTPDAIGNRAPLADPLMRAGVVGLSLSATLDDCARLYLAATQALAYQTRHIVDSMAAAGHPAIESVFACGGLAKNGLYSGTHADVLGLALHLPQEDEAVLLGSAILGATAGGAHPSVGAAMAAMTAVGDSVAPSTSAAVATYHDRKYQIFLKMSQDQIGYRAMMTGSGSGAEE
jgi:ribulose kinase